MITSSLKTFFRDYITGWDSIQPLTFLDHVIIHKKLITERIRGVFQFSLCLRGNTQLRRPFFSIFLLNIFSFYLTFSWKLLDFEERKIMHKLLKVQKKKRKREEKILKYFAEPASHEEQYQHCNYQASSSFHCSAGHERNCQYPLFKIKL